MENITKIRSFIQEAFSKYSEFEVLNNKFSLSTSYTSFPLPDKGDEYGELVHYSNPKNIYKLKSSRIIHFVNDLFFEYQNKFIEERRQYILKGLGSLEKVEQQRIEALALLHNWAITAYDGEGDEYKYKYSFAALEEHLATGKLEGGHGPACFVNLIANIKFYFWLKDLEKETPIEQPTPAQVKRLIWNGGKNALADVFYQLKTLCTDENKPFLDASNEQIAEFLKMNFECFNDTQISTIKEYLEKDEKRPKKATSKISVMRGFPPKD